MKNFPKRDYGEFIETFSKRHWACSETKNVGYENEKISILA
jgi:hypothetical protein